MATIARQTELKMDAEKGWSSQESNRTDCKDSLVRAFVPGYAAREPG